MIQKACNNFVLVLRDETETEQSGFELPSGGREKPHQGTIHAVGSTVQDEEIKGAVGQKCLFHSGIGWEIVYEEVVYLVLGGHEIIALP
jgi:co-chaperonin GroES (HSP10)